MDFEYIPNIWHAILVFASNAYFYADFQFYLHYDRAVLWTAEEQGYYGAKGYLNAHKSELKNFTLMMESDIGTFSPTGLIFFGSPEASCVMEEILK